MRARALRTGAGALAVVLTGAGCAAIVGLDQTYTVDAGAEALDASVLDGGGGDGGPLGDGAPSFDGAPAAEAGGDAGPTVYWTVDESFGYVELTQGNGDGMPGSLPVLAFTGDGADGGMLRAAYEASDSSLWLCQPTAESALACTKSPYSGDPVDILSNDAGDAVVVTQVQDTSGTQHAYVTAIAGGSGTYSSLSRSGLCGLVRGLSLSRAGVADVLLVCDELLLGQFPALPGMFTYLAMIPIVGGTGASSGAAGLRGDFWIAGGGGGSGVYAHALTDGGMLSVAQVKADTNDTFATDVAPLLDGGALLVGVYGGGSAGLFATRVDGAGDGGLLPPPSTFALPMVPALEPGSHTRVAEIGSNAHAIVGAAGTGLVLATVDDNGLAPLGSAPGGQEVAGDAGPSGSSLRVGGAVSGGDGHTVYVAFANESGSKMMLTRLQLTGR